MQHSTDKPDSVYSRSLFMGRLPRDIMQPVPYKGFEEMLQQYGVLPSTS